MNIVQYYSVEVLDTSFRNIYETADGTYYPPRLQEWGMAAVTGDDRMFFLQTSHWKYARVLHIFDPVNSHEDYVRVVEQIPPDPDTIRLFIWYYGELFLREAGELENNFYKMFKSIL